MTRATEEAIRAAEELEAENPPPLQVLMARVLANLPAIGKDSQAPANMGGYAFRSIEGITAALKPLLGAHGVLCLPRVLERVESERTLSSGKAMYAVNLHIEWTWIGPAGDMLTTSMWGEGTDMGDKSNQKAATAAFKSMLTQTFCIGDGETDAEAHDVPESTGSRRRGRAPAASLERQLGWGDDAECARRHNETNDRIQALDGEGRAELRSWREAEGINGWPLSPANLGKIDGWLDTWEHAPLVGEPASA